MLSQSPHSSTDQAMLKSQGCESYESMNHQRSTPFILIMGTYVPFELPLLLEHMFPLKFSTMLLLERSQHQLCVDFQNNCSTPMESGCQCSRAAGKILVAFHYCAAITVSHGQLLAQQLNVKRPYRVLRGTICLSLSLVPGLLICWLNNAECVPKAKFSKHKMDLHLSSASAKYMPGDVHQPML